MLKGLANAIREPITPKQEAAILFIEEVLDVEFHGRYKHEAQKFISEYLDEAIEYAELAECDADSWFDECDWF
ncbi:hypothetical protein SAMN05446037_100642 [Anaerovirgula multivorans]|uniref:Uncharacterized protein n=1 Tax=Anaerovirgula multivorans TaxID=312168 RepID=A0A239CP76_9FIRM|nr:hypothetical protein [Anaerovirgula multivorans]SNS21133.1 hypothetical protein SAMN05446037_100642 [Anaerovirgula multivorans]